MVIRVLHINGWLIYYSPFKVWCILMGSQNLLFSFLPFHSFSNKLEKWWGLLFLSLSANKAFVMPLLFSNKSNSTEQDLTVAHNVDRICQIRGWWCLLNVGTLLAQTLRRWYCITLLSKIQHATKRFQFCVPCSPIHAWYVHIVFKASISVLCFLYILEKQERLVSLKTHMREHTEPTKPVMCECHFLSSEFKFDFV